jgi:hypothetical protein
MATACSLELPPDAAAPGIAHCVSDADCLDGQVCEVGFCVVETSNRELVALQLTPPNNTELLVEQFPMVELEQGSQMPDLQILRPVLLTGTVGEVTADGRNLVAAKLLLRRVGPSIEGHDLRFQTEATRDMGFSVRLPHGEYDITVLPARSDLPPKIVRGVPVSVDVQYDIDFADASEYTQVTGRVVGTDTTGESIPLGGVRVVALDGADLAVSTFAETLEDGVFQIVIPSHHTQVNLVMTPTDGAPLVPRVVVEGIELIGNEVDLGDQSVGPQSLVGRVRGVVSSGDGVGIPDVRLVFEGEVGLGVVSVTAETGLDGSFTVALPGGEYDLVVVPGVSTGESRTELKDVVVDGSEVDLGVIKVLRKPVVSGALVSPSGDPIPFAQVEFRAESMNSRATVAAVPVLSTPTAEDGRFSLQVDPGVYDVVAVPGEGSGWAQTTLAGVEVGYDGGDIDLVASAPNLAYGVVLSPDGVGVGGVLVEIFRTSDDGELELVGSGNTDESGNYTVLVPAIGL